MKFLRFAQTLSKLYIKELSIYCKNRGPNRYSALIKSNIPMKNLDKSKQSIDLNFY